MCLINDCQNGTISALWSLWPTEDNCVSVLVYQHYLYPVRERSGNIRKPFMASAMYLVQLDFLTPDQPSTDGVGCVGNCIISLTEDLTYVKQHTQFYFNGSQNNLLCIQQQKTPNSQSTLIRRRSSTSKTIRPLAY